MDEPLSPLNPMKCIKTYSKTRTGNAKLKTKLKTEPDDKVLAKNEDMKEDNFKGNQNFTPERLTTKNAVKLLLEGTLKDKVCRYCLNTADDLSDLEELITIAAKSGLYPIAIKDMIASFHPVKVINDVNFPSKVCGKCLGRTISSYLFTQQCDQAERALRDCFEDIYEKVEKLDPLQRTKKRGRQKLKPNYNIIHAEQKYVIDYAEPTMHIISTVIQLPEEPAIQDFECLKCAQVLPNMISLLNHAKTHSKNSWFNCRLCGKSFPKLSHLKKHFRQYHNTNPNTNIKEVNSQFYCNKCGITSDNYQEFLQHVEKHKFKTVLEHLLSCKMDQLCAVCLELGSHMVGIEETVNLHGGFPELTGEKTVRTMIEATLPEMNILGNYTGNKICQKCFSKILTTYLFTNQAFLVRNRLYKCISNMENNLVSVGMDKNLCIEVMQSLIMPKVEVNIENKSEESGKIEVLEDEFRVKSDEDSEFDEKERIVVPLPIKEEVKEEIKSINRLPNGYQKDISEFLTFKTKKTVLKKFSCPLCKKHFVSDYFLKRHILKHSNTKVLCEICNMKFDSTFSLKEHHKTFHLLQATNFWSCKTCHRTFLTQNKFVKHQKLHFYIKCQLCDKIFKSQNHYNTHMQRHLYKLKNLKQKYVQNCSFCEKECLNDNELSLHVNKVHLQIKPYICDMCERQYYTEKNLKHHKKLHKLFSKEKCHFCNKTVFSRSKFVTHLRKHIGVKPFVCQICCEAFYTELKLKKHLILHVGNFR